jgi:hypothetical protein
MASSTAELTLLLNAKNMASSVVGGVSNALDGVAKKASSVGRALGEMGSSLGAGLGNLTENLLTGQDLGQAATHLGAFIAGETVQEFGVSIVQKMAGSTIVQAVGGAMSAFGSTIGGLIAAAIPIGMALWPVLLVGAIAAGIIFLINNPAIVKTILDFAGSLVGGIISGIGKLPGLMLDVIVGAGKLLISGAGGIISIVGGIVGFFLSIPGKLVDLGISIVKAIVGGLASLPGRIADVIRQAFANLHIDVGPFHIDGRTGVKIDLPDLSGAGTNVTGNAGPYSRSYYTDKGHAAGGWAGLHGPELSWLGEKGPEYVRRAGTGTGDDGGSVRGVRLVGISEDDILDMVDRGLYFRLQRAAPTVDRT